MKKLLSLAACGLLVASTTVSIAQQSQTDKPAEAQMKMDKKDKAIPGGQSGANAAGTGNANSGGPGQGGSTSASGTASGNANSATSGQGGSGNASGPSGGTGSGGSSQ
jgi:hypothetical protein